MYLSPYLADPMGQMMAFIIWRHVCWYVNSITGTICTLSIIDYYIRARTHKIIFCPPACQLHASIEVFVTYYCVDTYPAVFDTVSLQFTEIKLTYHEFHRDSKATNRDMYMTYDVSLTHSATFVECICTCVCVCVCVCASVSCVWCVFRHSYMPPFSSPSCILYLSRGHDAVMIYMYTYPRGHTYIHTYRTYPHALTKVAGTYCASVRPFIASSVLLVGGGFCICRWFIPV
jgi:hypothetical protein